MYNNLKWYEWLIAFVIVCGMRQVFSGRISFDNLFNNENNRIEKPSNRKDDGFWAEWRKEMDRNQKLIRGMNTDSTGKSYTDPYTGKTDIDSMLKDQQRIERDPFTNW